LRLLLDTHVALWAVAKSRTLPTTIADLIEAPANDIFVSVVSLWEIAIKHGLRRTGPGAVAIPASRALELFGLAGYASLDVKPAHALAVETLPTLHGDPFDRLLVAQALTEPMRLVTHDAALAKYSDTVISF
jgi:PIN domain nuclease of toxin-antitoxin system